MDALEDRGEEAYEPVSVHDVGSLAVLDSWIVREVATYMSVREWIRCEELVTIRLRTEERNSVP